MIPLTQDLNTMTRQHLIEAYVELHLNKEELAKTNQSLVEVDKEIWDLTLKMKASEIRQAYTLLRNIQGSMVMGRL